jgi:putative ATP-dependent endonuclease of the OLD family
MKLSSLSIRRYRTIDSIDVEFPGSYAAVCGPNDSGKTNIIRAIRAMMRDEDESPYFHSEDDAVTVKDDFPKWLDTPDDSRSIVISLQLEVDPERDAGLYQFLLRHLKIESAQSLLPLQMDATYSGEKAAPKVSVTCAGNTYEGLEAQEVFKKFQSSRSILFHNSPQSELARLRFREGFGQLRELSGEGAAAVAKLKRDMDKGFRKSLGISNRSLKDFLVDLRRSTEWASRLWHSILAGCRST